MGLTAHEFKAKAEGLKSKELEIRQSLERVRNNKILSEQNIQRSNDIINEYRMKYEAARNMAMHAENGSEYSAQMNSLQARINIESSNLNRYTDNLNECNSMEQALLIALEKILNDENETLLEIQASAMKTNQNKDLLSTIDSAYSGKAAEAYSSFAMNLSVLGDAAGTLGGVIQINPSNMPLSTRSSQPKPIPKLTREAAYVSLTPKSNPGSGMGQRSGGGSANSVSNKVNINAVPKNAYMNSNYSDKKPSQKKGLGARIAHSVAKFMGMTHEFEGFKLSKVGNQYCVDGDNPELYKSAWNDPDQYEYSDVETDEYGNYPIETISPDLIEGLHLSDYDIEHPEKFWQQHAKEDGTFETFLEIAKKIPEVRGRLASGATLADLSNDLDPLIRQCSKIYFDPQDAGSLKVIKVNGYYEFSGNGRHRLLAAKKLGFAIPVQIRGIRTKVGEPKPVVTPDSSRKSTKVDDYGKHYREGDKLLPNNEYTIKGYKYKTDNEGRIISVSGMLRLKKEKRSAITDKMQSVGQGDQHEDDDRGHLIADMFDGPNGIENLVAMSRALNRSEYKTLENTFRSALKEDKVVEVKIMPIYDSDTHRPTSIKVEWSIDGVEGEDIFEN